jgi:hypothetical protein
MCTRTQITKTLNSSTMNKWDPNYALTSMASAYLHGSSLRIANSRPVFLQVDGLQRNPSAVYGPGSRGCRKGKRMETYLLTFTISRHGGLRHSECLSSRLNFAALVILFVLTTALVARTYFALLPLGINLLLYVS